jgi:hypothetical protein
MLLNLPHLYDSMEWHAPQWYLRTKSKHSTALTAHTQNHPDVRFRTMEFILI